MIIIPDNEPCELSEVYDTLLHCWQKEQEDEQGCFLIYAKSVIEYMPHHTYWTSPDIAYISYIFQRRLGEEYKEFCRFRPFGWQNKFNDLCIKVFDYGRDSSRLVDTINRIWYSTNGFQGTGIDRYKDGNYASLVANIEPYCQNIINEHEAPLQKSKLIKTIDWRL